MQNVNMSDADFEKLKESIRQKTKELRLLQDLYFEETGQYYMPGLFAE